MRRKLGLSEECKKQRHDNSLKSWDERVDISAGKNSAQDHHDPTQTQVANVEAFYT